MYNLVFRQACLMIFLLIGSATSHTLRVCHRFLKANHHKLLHIYYTNDNCVVFECKGDVVPDDSLTQSNVECITEITAISRQLEMCNTMYATFHGVISSDHRWKTQLPFLKSVTLDRWKQLFHEKQVHCKSVTFDEFGVTMQLESYYMHTYTISVKKGKILVNSGNFKTPNLRVLLDCDLKNC